VPYMAGESPQGAEGRRAEADRILHILVEHFDSMTAKEFNFVDSIAEGEVSPKQLYWLRDIKDKYCA
jgi:hypothetical protein